MSVKEFNKTRQVNRSDIFNVVRDTKYTTPIYENTMLYSYLRVYEIICTLRSNRKPNADNVLEMSTGPKFPARPGEIPAKFVFRPGPQSMYYKIFTV